MGADLSDRDLRRLEPAMRALLHPLNHHDVDGWRSEVCRKMRDVLEADMATFLLPLEGVEPLYSEEVDTGVLRGYSEYARGFDRDYDLWRRQVELGVWNRRTLWGRHLEEIYASDYWGDFVVPLRAYDSLGASVALEGIERPATLFFYHTRPAGPKFGERGLTILRLLYPAFEAGVRSLRRLASYRQRLERVVDAFPYPLLVADPEGRELNRNAALQKILDREPESSRIVAEARRVAERLGGAVATGGTDVVRAPAGTAVRRLETAEESYRLVGSFLEDGLFREDPTVLLAVQTSGIGLPSPAELVERYGLTEREAEVALLLARRFTNAEMAEHLVISPHTARHHTERVLGKLRLHSRRRVREVLLGDARPSRGHGG